MTTTEDNLLVRVAPSIFLVLGEGQGRFPFAHSILVRDGTTALIDTGCGIERLRRLKDRYRPDVIVNSHTHPDHSAGNWVFEGTPVLVPREGFDTSGRMFPLSERLAAPGVPAQQWRAFVQGEMGFRDAPPTDAYGDGHRFQFDSVELVAIHTPGHCVDHYCFFEPQQGILLSGDIDLTPFGPWYGHRESSIDQSEASIRQVRALQPRVVVSSHLGLVFDEIDERFQAFAHVIDQREQRILDCLAQPQTVESLVEMAPIYGRFPYQPVLMRYWEGQMIAKHLARLKDKALIGETEGGYVRK